MSNRTCSTPMCNRRHHARGLCSAHYRDARRELAPPCSVEGCSRAIEYRSWCRMHYGRWLATGELGEALSRQRPRGTGHVNDTGYLVVVRHGHPLAGALGRVYAHRAALYDHVGSGSHACHWCGSQASWEQGLTADHLDWDRTNNDADNLVPSCLPCNSKRYKARTDRGEQNPAAKLTAAQVAEIRASSGVTQRALAAQYGVSQSLISQVKSGRIWQ